MVGIITNNIRLSSLHKYLAELSPNPGSILTFRHDRLVDLEDMGLIPVPPDP